MKILWEIVSNKVLICLRVQKYKFNYKPFPKFEVRAISYLFPNTPKYLSTVSEIKPNDTFALQMSEEM